MRWVVGRRLAGAAWVGVVESLEARRLMHAGHEDVPLALPSAPIGPASEASGIVSLGDIAHQHEHALADAEGAAFRLAHPEGPPPPVITAATQDASVFGQWGAVMNWP